MDKGMWCNWSRKGILMGKMLKHEIALSSSKIVLEGFKMEIMDGLILWSCYGRRVEFVDVGHGYLCSQDIDTGVGVDSLFDVGYAFNDGELYVMDEVVL